MLLFTRLALIYLIQFYVTLLPQNLKKKQHPITITIKVSQCYQLEPLNAKFN